MTKSTATFRGTLELPLGLGLGLDHLAFPFPLLTDVRGATILGDKNGRKMGEIMLTDTKKI